MFLPKVKECVLEKEFKIIDEETYFFKNQKIAIVSIDHFLYSIYKIETKKPYGAKPIWKYLNDELKKSKDILITISNFMTISKKWCK